MERAVDDVNILTEFCEQFCGLVEQCCKYIVVSGFVAIASGRTRGTEDIDMVIEKLDAEKFSRLYASIFSEGFVCMQSSDANEIYSYLKDGLSVRFTWKDKALPEMELKFAKDELDQYQLMTRTKLELTGLDIWFSNVNVNIAFKEHLLKSPKDMEDARHLRIVYSEQVDDKEISHVKGLIQRCRLNE